MKAIGEKVLGWFIVQEGDERAPEPAASEVRAVVTESRTAPPPPTARSAGSVVPLAHVPLVPLASFADVYRRAGIHDLELERLTKTLDLVASLPAEATASVKRTIVEAALQAFGIPLDRIADAALAALTALDRHVTDGEARTDAVRASTEEQIRKLNVEIERLRSGVDSQIAGQEAIVHATARERARVSSVLEFFGRSRS